MKRVLFIAYLFPPIANSGTQRPLKFAKYLPQFGWDPLVLTAARLSEHRLDEQLLEDVPAGVRVVRVPMLNDRIGAVAGRLGLGVISRARIAEGISWRMREHWRTPDLFALWRPTARRAAMRLFRDVGFDAIYATGFPWTSLLTGMDISIMTGRPLVADFRDPWAAEDLYQAGDLERAAELKLERQVVNHAAAIVSISGTMTERMIAAHPEVNHAKFVTIPNGFDPDDMQASSPWPHQRLRIVYAGVWKEGYGLDALYDAIDAISKTRPQLLSNVEVVAAGFEPGPAARRGLTPYVVETGVLPHPDAVALMESADILFLPNGDGSRQQWCLPGKIFEYLATGRPVLAVTDPNGEAGRLIRLIGGGVVIAPSDQGGLTRVLAEAFARGAMATPERNRAALRAFERPALTKLLSSVLENVTRQRAAANDVQRGALAGPRTIHQATSG